jgi:hypothetical protein
MLSTIRKVVRNNLPVRKFVGYYLASSGLFDSYFRNYKLSPDWEKRMRDILSCPDFNLIPKVKNAGAITSGKQIMHNGVRIHLGSYYGPDCSKMMQVCKGVHEPQEERVFMEALKTLPSGALMIEMGSFWSFYSMWFNRQINGAVNYMIEPDKFNLGHGERNFRLNGMTGNFFQGFIAEKSGVVDGVSIIAIDDFVKQNAIRFIHMLHSDIQGYEYEMLMGARNTFQENKVGYVFISTHSNEVHYKCLSFLKERDFIIIANADMNQTYSVDGLIAARARAFNGIEAVDIALRTASA